MSDIVKFPQPTQGQTGDDRNRAFLDATRAVAKLSLLGRLEYERVRCKAAKELGCRVSFLDRVIEKIHEEVSRFKHDYRLSFAREEGECLISLYEDESTATPSWRLARAKRTKDANTEEPVSLLLLADGNFTVLRGYPLEKPEEGRNSG